MLKKLRLLFLLLFVAATSYAQTRVLVIGFPEKNFFSEWKPKEKLAKKNATTTDQVDDLYRDSLLDAVKGVKEGIEFVLVNDHEEELFAHCTYQLTENSKGKEYFGTTSFNKVELLKLSARYNVDLILHISQYRHYMSVGLNLHTKIVHRFDYLLIDRDFEIISADRFKFSGFFQGAFRPEGVKSNYNNKASIMAGRLAEAILN